MKRGSTVLFCFTRLLTKNVICYSLCSQRNSGVHCCIKSFCSTWAHSIWLYRSSSTIFPSLSKKKTYTPFFPSPSFFFLYFFFCFTASLASHVKLLLTFASFFHLGFCNSTFIYVLCKEVITNPLIIFDCLLQTHRVSLNLVQRISLFLFSLSFLPSLPLSFLLISPLFVYTCFCFLYT